jgi:hypothetical protein
MLCCRGIHQAKIIFKRDNEYVLTGYRYNPTYLQTLSKD